MSRRRRPGTSRRVPSTPAQVAGSSPTSTPSTPDTDPRDSGASVEAAAPDVAAPVLPEQALLRPRRPAPPGRRPGGLDALMEPPPVPPTPARAATNRTALRAAGVPLLAAAVVGGTATGAAAADPATSPGAVPQAGSHTTAAPVAGTPVRAPRATPRPAATPKPSSSVTYVVQAGDTLSEIAHRAGIRLVDLLAANHLRATDTIYPGQRLVLPGARGPVPGPGTPPPVTPAKPKPVVHVVVAGETLSGIAQKYKITVAAIMTANKLTSDVIRPGQKLVLPGVKPVPPKAPVTHVVVVKAGDTLSGIARREGTTLAKILELNRLTASSVITPGQKLVVPGPPYPNSFAGRTYPDSVARAAAANRAILARRTVPSRAQMQALVVRTARALKVDPSLAQAIAYQESGFNMKVVSPANAIGCMQVIPSSGVWASRLVGRRLDLLDPEDNVTAGVAILAALVRAAPDERTAIAGYYQGLGSVQKNGMFPDTRRYVASVLRLQTRFS